MEEKKNTGLLVVVAILCLIVGLAGGYFLFGKKVLTANNSGNKQEIEQNDDNNVKKCNYNKLKRAGELTDTEINEILKLVDRKQAIIVSIDEYVYEVYSEVSGVGPIGQSLYTTVWKENGKWVKGEKLDRRYDYNEETIICKECGDCQKNDNKLTVVSTPVYDTLTETLPKGLVGNFVNTENPGSSIEFKNDGTIEVSLSGCELFYIYTNRQIKYTGFYSKSGEKSFNLSISEGSYNFGGPAKLLHFDVVGDIESGNVSLKSEDDYGCSLSNVYKKK